MKHLLKTILLAVAFAAGLAGATMPARALVEIDVNKRRDALQRAIAVMNEDPPFLWMVSSAAASAYNPKKLKGFVPGAVEETRYDLLEKIG